MSQASPNGSTPQPKPAPKDYTSSAESPSNVRRVTSSLQVFKPPDNGSNDRVHEFVLRRALPPTTHRLPPCTISSPGSVGSIRRRRHFFQKHPATRENRTTIKPRIVRRRDALAQTERPDSATKRPIPSQFTRRNTVEMFNKTSNLSPKLFELLIIPHGCDECNGEFKKILSNASDAESTPPRRSFEPLEPLNPTPRLRCLSKRVIVRSNARRLK